MRIDCTVGFGDAAVDVRIEAPGDAQLADVRAALADAVGAPHDLPLWCGTDPLPATTPLDDSRLRTGARLDFGAATPPAAPSPVLALHVVGGPAAGAVAPLERGRLTIGRAGDNDVVLPDPDVSRRHAEVEVTATSMALRDLESSNGTWVAGRRIPPGGTIGLHPGDVLRAGDSLLQVAGPPGPPAAVHRAPDGSIVVRRSPQYRAAGASQVITMPTRSAHPRPRGVQWIAALLPAAAGAIGAWVYDQPAFLLFALLSPVMMIATAVGDRLHWRRANSRAAATLRGRRAAIERQIATELAAETARRRRAAPDPAAIRAAAAVPDTRVWSRQRADPELLRVRVGVAEQPATLQLRDGDTAEPAARLADVPFSVDLAAGPLGIAGPDAVVTACARWLVGQLATLAAPADVEFALVLDETRAGSWHWARWLPHVVRPVAISGTAGTALVTGLAALVDRRAATRRPGEHGWHGSWLVVVVDRCGADHRAGLADVLARAAGLGVTALWLGSDPAALPGCSAAVAQVSGINGTRAAVRAARDTEATDAVLDQVSAAWADELARSLAPLVDGGAADDRELPTECTLPAALHLGEVTPEAIADRWSHATGAAATVLGAGAAGIVRVDLAVDGPHVLVAGTTGAGKSELLRTLVIGLAASQPPSELNLLLIDYKGGAAFAECARLPHTAGVVTDLDADLTERALRSLHAELRRREQSFADAGAGDLTGYRSGSPAEPIPRLVIVVDEFAALAEELPDFLPGLIGVAQRGRSLGIHLVLATQRPGTAVSADIRANTALRIALRVTDAGESQDIIGSPAAAAVDPACPGQGWLRTGSTLTAFQAAHASGRSRAGATTARVERLDSWRRVRPRAAEPGTASDLSRLVDAVCEAARRSGTAPARSPWQPPLPDTLPRAQLTKAADRHVITLGRVDLPDEQRQETLDIDLGTGATLLVAGGPRSGRTNALTLLATGAAAGFSPREVHLHVVDGTGALAGALRRLPHATTVLGPAELELFPRLLDRLDRSVGARLSGGAGPVAGQPVLVLLVDGWDAVCAALPDALAVGCADRLAGLLRSARAARLVIGVTGERVLSTTRLATGFGQRLLLGAPERTDSVRRVRERPATFPPGRAVRLVDGALAQFAAPVTSAEVAAIGAASASASVDQRPGAIRIRPLPDHLLLSEIAAGPGLILGLGGDEPTPVYLDPFSGARRLLIAGPPRSGRSTALRLLEAQARRTGLAVLVAAPDSSPLAAQARGHGVSAIGPAAPRPDTPTRPTLVLVDDSDAFADTAAGDRLVEWARDRDLPVALVAAARAADLATSYRGVAAEVRRHRCGVLLSPGPLDGELLGVRLPRRAAGGGPPGRGFAVGDPGWGTPFADGEPVPVQVATPDAATRAGRPCAGNGDPWPARTSP